jgi:hypothetical protein
LDRRTLRRFLWAIVALSPAVRLATNALTVPGESYLATFCRLDVLAMGALVPRARAWRPSVGRGIHRRRP